MPNNPNHREKMGKKMKRREKRREKDGWFLLEDREGRSIPHGLIVLEPL
jgi:hypothetical protein